MKKLIYILFFLFTTVGVAQNEDLFDKANQAYADGKYQDAVQLYDEILENGETSAAVHYNLGNAHYKLNHIAPSIYHYEKALQMAPGDKDVENNLSFARNMAIDAIAEPSEEGFLRLFNRVTSVFTTSGWAWAAIICMLLFVVLFLGYYFSRRAFLKRSFFISGFFFLFVAVTSAAIGLIKQNVIENSSFAIVFSEEAEVKSEPNIRSAEVFELHEGAKVKLTEDFQGWYEIELPNGSQGWIKQTEVKRL